LTTPGATPAGPIKRLNMVKSGLKAGQIRVVHH
jgi:hypothetical protein